MPDYKNGKLYTIRCKTDEALIYVGSTLNPLYKRMYGHNQHARDEKRTSLLYTKMRELGIDNFYIELYEEYPCNNKEQLNKREGEVIRLIGTLNEKISGRTFKEYYNDHKEKLLEHNKEYYNENKERVLNICKEYRETHKEQKKETDRLYRENNKEKIKEIKTELYKCECGCSFQRDNIARHNKSKFHLDFIANQTNT